MAKKRKYRRYTEEFKLDATSQVINKGYAASDVASRLGMSSKTLYKWLQDKQKPSINNKQDIKLSNENRKLKAELARVTEERDILKKATAYFAKDVL